MGLGEQKVEMWVRWLIQVGLFLEGVDFYFGLGESKWMFGGRREGEGWFEVGWMEVWGKGGGEGRRGMGTERGVEKLQVWGLWFFVKSSGFQ